MSIPKLSDPYAIIVILGIATLVYFIARRSATFGGHDPREPPLAPQSIPFIGHMLGMSKSSFNYYVELRYETVPFGPHQPTFGFNTHS